MKTSNLFTLALMMASLQPSIAAGISTLEIGRNLFESTQLGKSDLSCAACHPDGKGLEKVGDFSDTELKDIINACVRDALHGTLFASDAQELNALMLYVRSFQAK